MNSLNYPSLDFFNGPAILCIFVFQITRRTSQETQQVFDWLISILHLGQVLSTVLFHSVCQLHVSGKGQEIQFALALAVFVKRVVYFQRYKLASV